MQNAWRKKNVFLVMVRVFATILLFEPASSKIDGVQLNCTEHTWFAMGQPIICLCQPTGQPQSNVLFTWTSTTKSEEIRGPVFNDTARIELHGETITCTVQDGQDTKRAQYKIQIAYGPLQLSVQALEVETNEDGVILTTSGKRYSMKCSVFNAHPGTSISWHHKLNEKQNVLESAVVRNTGGFSSVLSYTASRSDSEKSITCMATNTKRSELNMEGVVLLLVSGVLTADETMLYAIVGGSMALVVVSTLLGYLAYHRWKKRVRESDKKNVQQIDDAELLQKDIIDTMQQSLRSSIATEHQGNQPVSPEERRNSLVGQPLTKDDLLKPTSGHLQNLENVGPTIVSAAASEMNIKQESSSGELAVSVKSHETSPSTETENAKADLTPEQLTQQSVLITELIRANKSLVVNDIKKALEKYTGFVKAHLIDDKVVGQTGVNLGALELKNIILSECLHGNVKGLERAVRKASNDKYTDHLWLEIVIGKDMIIAWNKIKEIEKKILEMDKHMLVQIQEYTNPPIVVEDVLVSTMLVLGEVETLTRDWSYLKKLFNVHRKEGAQLFDKIKNFKLSKLHPEIAARCLEILHIHGRKELSRVYAGVAYFYRWARAVTDACMTMTVVLPKPTDRKRQRVVVQDNLEGVKKDILLYETDNSVCTPSSGSSDSSVDSLTRQRIHKEKAHIEKRRRWGRRVNASGGDKFAQTDSQTVSASPLQTVQSEQQNRKISSMQADRKQTRSATFSRLSMSARKTNPDKTKGSDETGEKKRGKDTISGNSKGHVSHTEMKNDGPKLTHSSNIT